ncbi:MAG: AsnC family transcriptional regulator [Bacteroidota bacterium]
MYQIDKTDRQILQLLLEDARMPFTEIAQRVKVSSGTVHSRVKKLEKHNIITGATLSINYEAVNYNFTAYVGIIMNRTLESAKVVDLLKNIPEVTVADIVSGQFSIFCKIRCVDTRDAKRVIFSINGIPGVLRTETMISLDEPINDKQRLFQSVFSR